MIATYKYAPAGRARGLRAQMVEKIADRFAQSVLGGAQQEWQLCAAFFVCGCDSIVSTHKREKQMAVARVEQQLQRQRVSIRLRTFDLLGGRTT